MRVKKVYENNYNNKKYEIEIIREIIREIIYGL